MKAMLLFLAAMVGVSSVSATGIEGDWTGVAVRGGEARPVSLHVKRENGALVARYDIPSLSLEGMPLAKFAIDAQTNAITTSRAFKGRLDGERITGELYPALLHGSPVTVELRRSGEPSRLATDESPVQFTSRGHVLKGLLVKPHKPGRYPALVSLHGSGPSTRWLALARARRFAAAGYAMLIFDKPGSGESQGDWTMTSLDEMAEDAIAAVDFLRLQPGVDAQKVGLWGHSQAGHVISRAGAMSDKIAFAIVLAGGGATPRLVEEYGYLGGLKRANATPEARAKAMAWVRDYFDYVRTGQGHDALSQRLKTGASEDWAKALGVQTVYPTPEQQAKWQWVATYDPVLDIRRIRFPMLLLFAEKDENSPSKSSLEAWRNALAAAGNTKVESKLFADADHHFLTPAHTDGWPSLTPGYYETQIDWLGRVVG